MSLPSDFDHQKYSYEKILKCLKIIAEEVFVPKLMPGIETLCPKGCMNLKEIDGEYYCVWKLDTHKGNPMRHPLCTIKDIKVDEEKCGRPLELK